MTGGGVTSVRWSHPCWEVVRRLYEASAGRRGVYLDAKGRTALFVGAYAQDVDDFIPLVKRGSGANHPKLKGCQLSPHAVDGRW